ncbi:MAG: hypothetical protein GXY44_15570 [Phycisphaerales bacterium]|nr:hypothetical protein [Phycisphaerales bacterium]
MVRFEDGVWIDWTRPQVELEATVIVREGRIDSFASSMQLREQKSIVLVKARPWHICQALGLIGLTPGRLRSEYPAVHIPEPSYGYPVIVEVRYEHRDHAVTDPLERWLTISGGDSIGGFTVADIHWVLARSMPLEEGSTTAEDEGVVVALVDLGSALVAPVGLNFDRNEECGLIPNTEHIPPLNTACRVIIRPGPYRITITSAGRFMLGGRVITLSHLAGRVRQIIRERPAASFEVVVQQECGTEPEELVIGLLRNLDIPETALTIRRSDSPLNEKHDPQSLAKWISRRFLADSLPRDSADPVARLADDLELRSLAFRERSENVAVFIRQLVHDLRQLFNPTTSEAIYSKSNSL